MTFFFLTWFTIAHELVPCQYHNFKHWIGIPVEHKEVFASEELAQTYIDSLDSKIMPKIEKIDIDNIAQEELEKLTRVLSQK